MKIKIMLAVMLFALFAKAQNTADFTGADQAISTFMNTWNIGAAGVAITKDGKLIYNREFGAGGAADTNASPSPRLFRIASVSKSVTSIAIMQLVQHGKLSLTDHVFGPGKILNQPYYTRMIHDKRIYNITIQDLLEHTAGWDRNVPVDGYSHSDAPFFPEHVAAEMNEPNPVGDSTLIRFMLKKGLNNAPGTHYAYSNVGYLVLGKVIEKISGMGYEDYVQSNILHPLFIYDMHLGKNLRENKFENEVEYLDPSTSLSCYGTGGIVSSQYGGFNLEAMNAHGGWIASANDLTRLMLAADGFSSTPDILNAETIALMTAPGKVNSHYAKGWSVNNYNNWWHTGSLDGTASFICRTNNGYTWAFLLNSRADNSSAFWSAFDRLPWACVKSIEADLATNYGKQAEPLVLNK